MSRPIAASHTTAKFVAAPPTHPIRPSSLASSSTFSIWYISFYRRVNEVRRTRSFNFVISLRASQSSSACFMHLTCVHPGGRCLVMLGIWASSQKCPSLPSIVLFHSNQCGVHFIYIIFGSQKMCISLTKWFLHCSLVFVRYANLKNYQPSLVCISRGLTPFAFTTGRFIVRLEPRRICISK